ncbi:hypothetical protein [Streptomyces sp. NPDC021356]|uniref:hypothetical protein n=1 Tax=Streptomyces sp. NPDC021356 TaxID=3154900 RepID=UPI0033ED0171
MRLPRQTEPPHPAAASDERTTAAVRTIIRGALPLGALVGGLLGAAVGTRPSIAVLGVAVLLPAGLTLASPIRRTRAIPDVAPAPPSTQ